jgi:nucleotide-binding universal stress UspA family protein
MASTSVPTAVSIKNIFFVTDLGSASRLAMPYAIALARRYHSQITLVHALGAVPFTPIPYEPVPLLDERPRPLVLPQMEELQRECIENGIEAQVALRDGEMLEVLNDELRAIHADLVILGTHSHGSLHRVLLGSHAEQVIRHTPCGVMMVGRNVLGAARWRDRLARILLATNFEDGSKHARDYVLPLAAEHHSEITVLHVVDEPAGVPMDAAEIAMHESNKKLMEFASTIPAGVKLELRLGRPEQEIVDYANRNNIDLIVLGRRKGGFFAEHKPTTMITEITSTARCPVLTLS